MEVQAQLQSFGLDAAMASSLASVLAYPKVGILDPEEDTPATPTALALQALLLGASELRRFAEAVPVLISALDAMQLSTYDLGRLWHVRGLVAWRSSRSTYEATRAFNRSIHYLEDDASPRANRYLARVHDTYGQLLHQQGMLSDAMHELERSLSLRDPADKFGAAITHGNLGRLFMEIGDFKSAADHLSRDLAILEELAPDLVGVRAQLVSHLADCHLRLGAVEQAGTLFERSLELAERARDASATMFAVIGRGRVRLARADAPTALAIVDEALARIEQTTMTDRMRAMLLASVHKLAGDAQLQSQRHEKAIDHYQLALDHLGNASTVSPMEYAEVFRGMALALTAKQRYSDAARSLRLALRHLDGTAAESLRLEVESDLKEASRDSWLLHSAGRFIGQQQIEFLLGEAGRKGFRGSERQVAVLFSDIRGFTTLSEQLQAEELISFLNDFLSHMTRCIEQCGGAVDKFIGDAVMAVFPLGDDHENAAVAASLAMREELERFNRYLGKGRAGLSIGIGIHGGRVVAGLIGSPQKREYTVIGDVVNTASRLEGMTKMLGAGTLVTSAVLSERAHRELLLRPLGRFSPKGRKTAIEVFDVMGPADRTASSQAMREEIERVKSALADLRARRFREAADRLTQLATDTARTTRAAGYKFLADKASALLDSPPPDAWSGEIVLVDK
jgi:class 3 adenylate cyclase